LHLAAEAPNARSRWSLLNRLIKDVFLNVHHIELKDGNQDEVTDTTNSTNLKENLKIKRNQFTVADAGYGYL
jgi:hypothetical protein